MNASIMKSVVGVVVAVVAVGAALVHGQATQHVWRHLTNRTAWVFLGLERADLTAASQIHFTVVKPGDDAKPRGVMPTEGAKIRLLEETPLIILGYRSTGEKRTMESPADVDISDSDDTGLSLPSGLEVVVKAIKKSQPGPGDKRAVWARVAPSEPWTRQQP